MTVNTIQPIRKHVTVQATPASAFEVFTARMTRWWNPTYSIGGQPFAAVVIEPREGGRWYERDAQGAECEWGRVVAWEPPERLVLDWQISGDWRPDSTVHTELEIRFVAEGPTTTRVELEHRDLEALGAQAEAMRAAFDSPDGWAGLLDRFAKEASGEA